MKRGVNSEKQQIVYDKQIKHSLRLAELVNDINKVELYLRTFHNLEARMALTKLISILKSWKENAL